MIEKMKFISIIGPKEEIDRVTSEYLYRYEIQLENTLSELKDLKNITPCADSNPYRDIKAKAEELAGRLTDGTQDGGTAGRMRLNRPFPWLKGCGRSWRRADRRKAAWRPNAGK